VWCELAAGDNGKISSDLEKTVKAKEAQRYQRLFIQGDADLA
jgi:hypothetical protein